MASTNGGFHAAGRPPLMYGSNQQEDDALSYSSTEQEVSFHEQLGTSQAMANTSQPINLSFNSGKMELHHFC